MCGRYGFYRTDEFAERFGIAPLHNALPDNYNAAPGQILPVIIATEVGRTLEPMKWGLIPHWAKDENIGYKMINARTEGIFEKPSWRGPIKYRRCLVPARGFYEWDKISSKEKQPYFIKLKEQDLFAFAGLYDCWLDTNGNEVYSYSIITTTAGEELSHLHDREPVMLKTEHEAIWLDPKVQECDIIADLLSQYPFGKLELHQVSKDVNIVRNNDEHLIYPINSQ